MKKAKKKKKKKLYGPSFDEKRQYILSLSFLSHSITSPSSIQDLPIKYPPYLSRSQASQLTCRCLNSSLIHVNTYICCGAGKNVEIFVRTTIIHTTLKHPPHQKK